MRNNVFANGREIACKAADGKSICAFPDVCFTPPDKVPPTPPGIPIPYPNTGLAKDTARGSKKVKISGKETMLKRKSYFKKSYGDEAGCATKKGIVTTTNRGKVYFNSWSMDVRFEGQNVVRHLDLTTHNHRSDPANTLPWPYLDKQALEPGGACHSDSVKEQIECEGYKPYGDADPCPAEVSGVPVKKLTQAKIYEPHYEELADETKKSDCLSARRCRLAPFNAKKDGVKGCCRGYTGDHVIDDANFDHPGGRMKNYSHGAAPCICAAGPNNTWAAHGQNHSIKGHFAKCYKAKHGVSTIPYAVLRRMSAAAVKIVARSSGCSQQCIEAQLDAYYKNPRKPIVDDSTPLEGVASGRTEPGYAKQLLKDLAE